MTEQTPEQVEANRKKQAEDMQERRKRLLRVLDHEQIRDGNMKIPGRDPQDPRVKFVSSKYSITHGHAIPGRFLVLTEQDGIGQFAETSARTNDIGRLAGSNYREGSIPVCYYDLDHLAGEEPPIQDGDRVEIKDGLNAGDRFTVTYQERERSDGDEEVWKLYDSEPKYAGELSNPRAYDFEVEVVERAPDFEDERLPLRYDVAAVNVVVAFNTIPRGD